MAEEAIHNFKSRYDKKWPFHWMLKIDKNFNKAKYMLSVLKC